MRLLAKFTLMFVVVFGIGIGACGYLFYGVLQRNARQQVLYNAQLLMDTALAMRAYTNDQVKPAIMQTMDQQRSTDAASTDDVFREICARKGFVASRVFRPQTVPAYGAAALFAELRKNYPDYFYKEASPNPTNPRNRSVDWEEDVIKEFRTHPDKQVFEGERETPFGRTIFLARPMRAPRACLGCHSTPDAAPPEMLKVYGPANGFGWKENDIIAAQIVSVPVSLPVAMANRASRHLLVALALVCLATLVIMNLLLYVTVVRPVSVFAHRADDISKGELDVPELPVRGKDEIATLAAAFNRMHRSMRAAMEMLDGGDAAREGEPAPEEEPEPEPERS